MRCFLLTDNIDKIALCMAGIEVHFYHLVPHIGLEHFNALKSVLCIEKSAIGQVITLNISVMSQKISLIIAIPSLRYNQIMSKTLNA